MARLIKIIIKKYMFFIIHLIYDMAKAVIEKKFKNQIPIYYIIISCQIEYV
ncbi:hypothetical protein GJV44_00213 [Candidatus Vallotia cooleyia]|nr:hypothetical protein GJV44_00213 [Candidatus Vallotia cooleyia]